MAKIIDPDNISFVVNATATTEEFEIQTGAKTLRANITSNNLNDNAPGKTSGATGRAIYSALKIEWLANATLRRYKFPIKMIFEGSFILTNGWTWADTQTEDIVRDAGFQVTETGKETACMISLGSMDNASTDLAYYVQSTGFTATPTDYDKTGEVNENVEITSAKTYMKSFLREQGKLYSEYSLLKEQGLSTLNFQAYSFPLTNGTDLKVFDNDSGAYSDTNIDDNTPFTGMSITYLKGTTFATATAATYVADEVLKDTAGRWFFVTTGGTIDAAGVANYTNNGGTAVLEAYDGEYQIGANYYAFNRIIDCNNGTHVQAYAWAQRQLRKAVDINTGSTTHSATQNGYGSVNGDVAELMAEFVGDNLKPKAGVLFKNFNTNSTNNIQHYPIKADSGGLDVDFPYAPLTAVEVPFPFVAAGNLNFSSNINGELDSETIYSLYFEYITRTISTNIAVTTASGNTATFTYSGTALDHLQTGDYIIASGFTNAANNTEYLVGTVTSGTSVTVTAVNTGATLVDEVLGASVQVDENPFGSLGAVIVKNNSGVDITGEVTASTIPFDFDYTNNNQGGRTPDTDAAVHLIALALDGAEWAEATYTISKATGQNITINTGDERNYSNPA